MGVNFSMADVYGPSYGYSTTRMQSVPEENDQEALADTTTATSDVHTDPGAKRNMVIALIGVLVVMVLFSINW
ncbi:TPA: hypothetical protein N6134_005063 [Escherichia coli]|nr:hypothetical protein [Escherichia coli]